MHPCVEISVGKLDIHQLGESLSADSGYDINFSNVRSDVNGDGNTDGHPLG